MLPRNIVMGLAVVLAAAGLAQAQVSSGDMNCDGVVDVDDIAPFALALTDRRAYATAFPACNILRADLNCDGTVDGFDIPLFVDCLLNGNCDHCPVVIEIVTVRNPGNPMDTRYPQGDVPGFGGVDYTYNIGTYEVTAGQYCKFLNKVAGVDTYGLYSSAMWSSSYGCKIERYAGNGTDGDPYKYRVDADWADRPVNWVGWGDAARFCNWLRNGQPTGAQDMTTTEDGSYFLDGAIGGELLAITRELYATWVIPSEDEWYKAAYHKNDGVTGNYWDYPTGRNTAPTSEAPPGTDMTNGSANYSDGGYAIGSPYYRTEVGAYDAKPSDSPYGTFDQGGNVFEWNEVVIDSFRCLRGSSFNFYVNFLHAADRVISYPYVETYSGGFRVAELPLNTPR